MSKNENNGPQWDMLGALLIICFTIITVTAIVKGAVG